MDEQSEKLEVFKQRVRKENIKKNQTEMNNTITEMRNTLEGIHSRLKEFRIMIVKMIQDLRKRMEAKIEKMQEIFNKDLEELKNKHLEELKNKHTEMNNTITEMKTTLEGINSRITEAENG